MQGKGMGGPYPISAPNPLMADMSANPYRLVTRAPGLTVQLMFQPNGTQDRTFILVGLDGMESFRLGPYDGALVIEDALKLVGTELRMSDPHGILQQINGSLKAARAIDRMGV